MAAHFQATEEKWPSSSISHNIIHQLLGENRKSVLHCKCFSILLRSSDEDEDESGDSEEAIQRHYCL
uniref:Uncharacterized protein n=1 Tax=Salix viminalis TaxID=40686 RepID=A0A6N2KGA8_SALVM